MRYLSLFIVVSLAITFCINDVFAQSSETEPLKSKVEMLEKELKEIKDLLKQQIVKDELKEKEIASLKGKDAQKEKEIASIKEEVKKKELKAAALVPGEESYFAKKRTEFEEKKLGPAFATPYTKPFLRRFGRNTYLGGYMDFQFRQDENGDGSHGFDQTRFIPFIYSDISDRVKLAAEIEFEHGGVGGGRDGETILEFATIDFLITDWINWRGGFILSPLGKFNLVHDSPLQDLTDRPLVNQFIIPTTLTDTGMGFFGSLYPSELSKLDYEIYVTNGVFHGLDESGKSFFNASRGLRSSRGGFEFDNENQSPGVVGRVAFSPFIGLEFGGSAYTQRYDDNNENQITIPALDFAYQRGAFELVGEGAYAFIETDDFATSKGIADSMWGYYVEGRYHFMPPRLKSGSPRIFTENSTFTGVLRWDQVQTSEIKSGERLNWLRNRITPGLNYRYTEDTVFKLDYQINMEEKDMTDISNNAFIFSVATYF
ncbi:MAG: hypothetical protein A2Z58_01505 [Planctomycetes bacterium RIFCSPHIGHO2_12_42_15]|nr:MAG: hypothetical protein A2Z58_01505 [Planctomycetes bacterium RIFCSPHIGHO2_12_42_15]